MTVRFENGSFVNGAYHPDEPVINSPRNIEREVDQLYNLVINLDRKVDSLTSSIDQASFESHELTTCKCNHDDELPYWTYLLIGFVIGVLMVLTFAFMFI